MTNFYDKNLKHKIEAFFDPCYRTGEYYSVSYLNTGCHFPDHNNKLNLTDDYIHNLLERKNAEESYEYTDTLHAIFNRSEGKKIWFIDSAGNELILKPHKIERFVTGVEMFYFIAEDYSTLCYTSNCILCGRQQFNDYGPYFELPENLGLHLVSYSFIPDYRELDCVKNPENYKNEKPMTDEERDIVNNRMSNPLYKCEEYKG